MKDALGVGEAAKAAVHIVKPVYEDAAQPAVRELGRFSAEAVRAILLPVRKAMEQFTEVVETLSARVADKVRDVPPERLSPPPANVAGPIIEAVRFVPPDSPLHELYANLLAQSMDASTAATAHPAFVAIIAQLTPDEARILAHLEDRYNIAVLTVDDMAPIASTGKQTWTGVIRLFTLVGSDAQCTAPELAPAYLDNMARLGILEHKENFEIADEAEYQRLEQHAAVTNARAQIEAQEGHSVHLVRSFFSVTDFGRLLIGASVRPPAP